LTNLATKTASKYSFRSRKITQNLQKV